MMRPIEESRDVLLLWNHAHQRYNNSNYKYTCSSKNMQCDPTRQAWKQTNKKKLTVKNKLNTENITRLTTIEQD